MKNVYMVKNIIGLDKIFTYKYMSSVYHFVERKKLAGFDSISVAINS